MNNPFKGDKEKLAKMNFRQKVDYIWTYYKHWFLIGAVAIFIVVGIIQAQVSYNAEAMNLLISDGYCENTTSVYKQLNNDFREFTQLGSKAKDPLYIDDTITFSEDTGEYTAYVLFQKFMALVLSGDADLMIAPQSTIVYYGAEEIFADLSEVLSDEVYNYLLEEDLLIETTVTPDDDEIEEGAEEYTFYCGIDLTGLDYFTDLGIIMDDMTAGIFVAGANQDLAIDYINMLFGFESETAVYNIE